MKVETAKTTDRLLALEVRPRVTGFVAFETPSRLLDWGRRKHHISGDELARVAAKKIVALLDLHQPSVVVIRARTIRSLKARRKIRTILRVVRGEAKKRPIKVQTISASAVRQFFAPHQCTSKYQRATLIARQFPELSWKLPQRRKAWKSEDHRMVIFDAAATALAFMNRSPPTNV